jgi:hypothetical protein
MMDRREVLKMLGLGTLVGMLPIRGGKTEAAAQILDPKIGLESSIKDVTFFRLEMKVEGETIWETVMDLENLEDTIVIPAERLPAGKRVTFRFASDAYEPGPGVSFNA